MTNGYCAPLDASGVTKKCFCNGGYACSSAECSACTASPTASPTSYPTSFPTTKMPTQAGQTYTPSISPTKSPTQDGQTYTPSASPTSSITHRMWFAIVNDPVDIAAARDLMPDLLTMEVIVGSTSVEGSTIRSAFRLEGYSVTTFDAVSVRLGFRKSIAKRTGGMLEDVTITNVQAVSWRRRRLQSEGRVEDPSRRRLASGVVVEYEVQSMPQPPSAEPAASGPDVVAIVLSLVACGVVVCLLSIAVAAVLVLLIRKKKQDGGSNIQKKEKKKKQEKEKKKTTTTTTNDDWRETDSMSGVELQDREAGGVSRFAGVWGTVNQAFKNKALKAAPKGPPADPPQRRGKATRQSPMRSYTRPSNGIPEQRATPRDITGIVVGTKWQPSRPLPRTK